MGPQWRLKLIIEQVAHNLSHFVTAYVVVLERVTIEMQNFVG